MRGAVHALIVGAPDKQRADPAVLRALCSNVLGNGKVAVDVAEFQGWASVAADAEFQFDWDDAAGDARRRAAALALEKLRQVGGLSAEPCGELEGAPAACAVVCLCSVLIRL